MDTRCLREDAFWQGIGSFFEVSSVLGAAFVRCSVQVNPIKQNCERKFSKRI